VTAKEGSTGLYVLTVDAGPCRVGPGAQAPESLPGTLVVNEVLYHGPAGSAGDANGDGVANASEDAFVELVNTSSSQTLDLGGVTLRDTNSPCDPSGRHVLFSFPCGTRLAAGRATVVFGGGEPYGSFGTSAMFVSSFPERCRLHLDPGGETLRLVASDSSELSRFSYPAPGACDSTSCTCEGASCARDPDTSGPFAVSGEGGGDPFTPGRRRDGTLFAGASLAPNDLCENAQPVTPGEQVAGDGAQGSNNDRGSCGLDGPELVYRFTLAETRDVLLSAPGASALYVRDRCARSGFLELGCAAGEELRLPDFLGDPARPRTYFVFVEAPGPFGLHFSATPPVTGLENDRCATGRWIEVGQTLSGQTTVGASDDYRPALNCGPVPSTLAGPDVAYRIWLSAGQRIRLTAAPLWPFDPAVFVASDCTTRETTCLAASDVGASGEPESLTFTAPSAGLYFVIVDSYAPFEVGTFDLVVEGLDSP
jgi:hypothetical protein